MRCLAFAATALLVGGIGLPHALGTSTQPAPVPRTLDPNGYWGFAVGLYPREAGRRGFAFPPDFGEVRSTGATHVLLPVSFAQKGTTGVVLAPSGETLADSELRRAVQLAHGEGLGVVLLPIIEVEGGGPTDWRGVLRPSDPDAWWDSYTRFLLHYAELAERTRIDMLVVGSELSSLSGPGTEPRWERLVEAVRAKYGGPLAYGANHDALDRRAPFSFVDVVGVSAYFPLTRDPNADSPEAYRKAWRRIARRLAKVKDEVEKPLVLLEVGYPSVAGAARRPWNYTSGAPIDLEEQRAAYAALTDAALDADWLDGVLFWSWLGPGGPHERWYTPRGKPAMAEATRLLRQRGQKILRDTM